MKMREVEDNVSLCQALHESPGSDQRQRIHPHPCLGVQNPHSIYQYFLNKNYQGEEFEPLLLLYLTP
jgi:hypothetical protein